MRSACGSGTDVAGATGPIGQNVSKLFPRLNWPEDERQLPLEVDLRAVLVADRGDDDGIAVAARGAWILVEHHQLHGRGAAHLGGMVGVVLPDGDDGGRAGGHARKRIPRFSACAPRNLA
jgi:hypothetical protein